MIARDVERLEVVVVALDLGTLGDREAEPGEDRDDLVVNARQGMQRSPGRAAARQREIEPPSPALGPPLGRRGRGQPRLQELLELPLGLGGRRAGRLERRHELRVREPDLAARGVDPHDPEGPRLALLLLAAAVGEGARSQDRFSGGLVELATAAEVALRLLEDLLAPSARLRSTFCPWHSPTPLRSQIRDKPPQPGCCRFLGRLALSWL